MGSQTTVMKNNNPENCIIFLDTSPLSSKSKEEFGDGADPILNYIYDELMKKKLAPVSILGQKNDDDEKILYRPYESFTRSPEWSAGRFVGEMVVTLPDNLSKIINKRKKTNKVDRIKLIIKPRFGTPFLCRMLEEISNFRMPESDAIFKNDDKIWNKLYQLILRQIWISKFAKADKYGLPRQTIKRIHHGVQIRGHLNVRKSMMPLFLKNEVISEYREKEVDDVIGRIVYKAYDILADKKTGLKGLPPQVQESVNTLISRYHGKQFTITEQDFRSIRYKSIYMNWKPLVDFSWQIIKHRGYDPEQSIDERGYGLFFDMAEIWEAYVGKILEKDFMHCTDRNTRIRLFANEDDKEFQRIIPDYLSRGWTDDKAAAVGDAKYMNLAGKEMLQAGQTHSVYYKTIMYMYRFNSTKGFIFYPMEHSDPAKSEREFVIGGEKRGSLYTVGLRLPEYNENTPYKDYCDKLDKREQAFQQTIREFAFPSPEPIPTTED